MTTLGPWGWFGHPQKPKPILFFFFFLFLPFEVARPPPKAQTHSLFFFGLLGWPEHPPGPRGGFDHPIPAVGCGSATLCPKMGWFGVAGATPLPKNGVALNHPISAVGGGWSHPLSENGVVRPPYFWARGWLEPPRFPSPHFF
jgi:hypothetical protein